MRPWYARRSKSWWHGHAPSRWRNWANSWAIVIATSASSPSAWPPLFPSRPRAVGRCCVPCTMRIPEIRALAIIAVGRQKITEAIPELELCLQFEDLEQARHAAAALAAMPPQGWQSLEELSASPNPVTALAAGEALARARKGVVVEELPAVLSLVLALLVMTLAVFAAAAFRALFKGCFALRRSLRANSYDFGSLLLKSPIVPGVSVVLAPPDASPESRALLRRLLDLTFGRHEVVLVLDGPSALDLDRWIQDFQLSPAGTRSTPRSAHCGHSWMLRVARSDSPAGGREGAGRSGGRAQCGRQCGAISGDRAGGSRGRFHPGGSAVFDSPHAGRLGAHGGGLRRGAPAPGHGPRGMHRRHRIAASVVGAMRRIQRVEQAVAGPRRLHAGQTRCGLFGWRIPRRSAGIVSGLARRPARESLGLACRLPGLAGQFPARRRHVGRLAPPGEVRSTTTGRRPCGGPAPEAAADSSASTASAHYARYWKPPPMFWLPPVGSRGWSHLRWRRWYWWSARAREW